MVQVRTFVFCVKPVVRMTSPLSSTSRICRRPSHEASANGRAATTVGEGTEARARTGRAGFRGGFRKCFGEDKEAVAPGRIQNSVLAGHGSGGLRICGGFRSLVSAGVEGRWRGGEWGGWRT